MRDDACDLAPDTTVYTKTRRKGGDELCLHIDPECPRLAPAHDVNQRPRKVYGDDVRVCLVCQNQQGVPHGTSGSAGPWQALKQISADEIGAEADPADAPAADPGGVADAD